MADLGSPLPFPDGAFDDVIAVLVLHYLQDWGPAPGRAAARADARRAKLIVAVDHPFCQSTASCSAKCRAHDPSYFATYNWTGRVDPMGGQTDPMSFWNRPLHAMTDAFTAAGFRISVISEPHPVAEARELYPDELTDRPSFLCFLFFVLHAD